jgi:5-oxoprolinase (ATP-hydrolysing)
VVLILTLVKEQSIEVVDFYMHAIMSTAEKAVRDLLRHVAKRSESKTLLATDWLDDGTQLVLNLTIDAEDGSAVFDFTGTSPQMYVISTPISWSLVDMQTWELQHAKRYSVFGYHLRAPLNDRFGLASESRLSGTYQAHRPS